MKRKWHRKKVQGLNLKAFTPHLKALAIVLSLALIFQARLPDRYFEISRQMELFGQVLKKVNNNYVEEVDPSAMTKSALEAMFKSLDPYTNYYSGSVIEEFKLRTAKEFGDIGAEIFEHKKGVVIGDMLKGFPAQLAGLHTGDRIVEVSGRDVSQSTLEEVQELIKSNSGERLGLKVLRLEKESLDVLLKMDKVKRKDVSFFSTIGKDFGYIKLDQFLGQSTEEIKKAWAKIPGPKKGMILDLRGNPGGLLREAITVSNLFIPKNKMVVFTKGKSAEWESEYKSPAAATYQDLPVVVLINEKSASASEIVSGVLQDYDRGLVLGQQSLGKGLVQQTKPLTFGTQMKLTTAKYYTPSGRCVQSIDYFNRGLEEGAKKIPDSLVKTFKTQAGRTVRDGVGIEPDIAIAKEPANAFVKALKKNWVFFDFAVEYYHKNPKPKDSLNFNASEAVWTAFVQFYDALNFEFEVKSERRIKDLRKALEEDQHGAALEVSIVQLEKRIEAEKVRVLENNKKTILEILEEEISVHYFFEKGRPQSKFDDDPVLSKALELLNNPQQVQVLLRP